MADLIALQTRFINEYQQGRRIEVGEEMIADDVTDHSLPPGIPRNKQGVLAFHAALHGAFPDLVIDIHDMLVDGDKVVTRKSFRATHQGDFLGIPATGKPIELGVIDIVRYRDEQLVEHWNQVDMFGLMQQLGVIPA